MPKHEKNKTDKFEKVQFPTTFSDGLYDEPRLWEYKGFDDPESSLVYARAYNRSDDHDCKDCFFRSFFRDYVTQGVLHLRGGEY